MRCFIILIKSAMIFRSFYIGMPSIFFGKHSWYNVPTALKAVQTSNLDDDTKELVAAYIAAQDEPELTDKIHHKKKIAKALEKLEINDVIIPCRILNDRQCGRFPCAPLCTRIQGL